MILETYFLLSKCFGVATASLINKNDFLETPIWYNQTFSIQIIKEWREKGIMAILDFIHYVRVPLSLEEINSKSDINMNFLGYAR